MTKIIPEELLITGNSYESILEPLCDAVRELQRDLDLMYKCLTKEQRENFETLKKLRDLEDVEL
jgi:hypothetical protein